MVLSTTPPADERPYWLLLNSVTGIGPARFQRLLEICGGARAAWHANDVQLARAGLERRSADALRQSRNALTPEAAVLALESLAVRALVLTDEEYPTALRQIPDPPPELYLKGQLPDPVDYPYVAIVGTRRITAYGRAVAERIAGELAALGVTVVSGLARGIDTAVHRAALEVAGRTVAVLGNGLDQVYPAENSQLARRIVASGEGGLLSEFAPGVRPDAANFPRRNRVVAGLCAGTVIVEAGERSGALITADFALEQGREVMAVPGSILSPMSVGPNNLLKQGAVFVTSARDVLDALGLELQPAVGSSAVGPPGLEHRERDVYSVLGTEPRHVDEIARISRHGAAEVMATLTLLELRGLVRNVGAMAYVRTNLG